MLKRVAISDVELGMFVHKMEGSWLKHPFWKFRFMLDDPDNLSHLKSSELESVIIDTSKGRDSKPVPATVGVAPERRDPGEGSLMARYKEPVRHPASRIASLTSRQSVDLQSTESLSLQREVGNAQIVADKAQKAVSKVFLDARVGKAVNLRSIEPVVKDIYASIQRNGQAFSGLMRCKLNNEFVYRHALAVSALMVSLARRMKLSPNEVREAGIAGMFLDIGTMQLPAELAPPNGDYRNVDPEIWQEHVRLGVAALEIAGGIAEPVVDACLQHHERFDGSGFPQGLTGPDITRFARMAAICDTFDYLLTDSEQEKALDPTAAITRLKEMDGAFDPDILRCFIESVGIHPVGSFVKLRSNRLAMVIDQQGGDLVRPVVRVFYSLVSDQRVSNQTIELANCASKDEIVGLADFTGLVLPDEAQLRELIFLGAHKMGQ